MARSNLPDMAYISPINFIALAGVLLAFLSELKRLKPNDEDCWFIETGGFNESVGVDVCTAEGARGSPPPRRAEGGGVT